MIKAHLERQLTESQRRRWFDLLLSTADEVGLPADPEFRSAMVGYLEWGSRLAVVNSQPGAEADPMAPMPRWGWGEVKGPYDPP
jgi:hemoglobin